mmetsp:Transcript_114327/g.220072  ORF Transcript_114327/g.220072 Transcript_114327/m.220072 type:complete len:251 (+) Transcript_114327:652-1404(+)
MTILTCVHPFGIRWVEKRRPLVCVDASQDRHCERSVLSEEHVWIINQVRTVDGRPPQFLRISTDTCCRPYELLCRLAREASAKTSAIIPPASHKLSESKSLVETVFAAGTRRKTRLADCCMEQPGTPARRQMVPDRLGTCRLAEDSDLLGVATKARGFSLQPPQCLALVFQAPIGSHTARRVWKGREAKDAYPIVHARHDDVVSRRESAAIVGVGRHGVTSISRIESTAIDPHHHCQVVPSRGLVRAPDV